MIAFLIAGWALAVIFFITTLCYHSCANEFKELMLQWQHHCDRASDENTVLRKERYRFEREATQLRTEKANRLKQAIESDWGPMAPAC